MTPFEFIEKNVHDELRKMKFPEGICFSVARGTRTKEFTQTLNPFNTNADGSVKTRSEIQAELSAQAKAYRDRNEAIYHAKCKD